MRAWERRAKPQQLTPPVLCPGPCSCPPTPWKCRCPGGGAVSHMSALTGPLGCTQALPILRIASVRVGGLVAGPGHRSSFSPAGSVGSWVEFPGTCREPGHPARDPGREGVGPRPHVSVRLLGRAGCGPVPGRPPPGAGCLALCLELPGTDHLCRSCMPGRPGRPAQPSTAGRAGAPGLYLPS